MSEPASTASVQLPVAGVSHIGLSVADLDAAVEFWTRVMGFEVISRLPTLCFVVHRPARLGIALTDHGGDVRGAFDERHTGLDHLALAVPDATALHAWATRLDDLAIPNSGVVETELGRHLNLRAPDQLPVELFAVSPAAAAAFGLPAPG